MFFCEFYFFFFKQKTAYDLRISDWSSDVCSSDLAELRQRRQECMACPTRRSGKRSGFENVGESSRGPPRKQIGAHQPSRVLGKVGAVSKRRRRADRSGLSAAVVRGHGPLLRVRAPSGDRKSTRLNSSH